MCAAATSGITRAIVSIPIDRSLTTTRRRIAVVGEQNASPGAEAAAEEVGRLIAQRGGIVICGGLSGVMEAAARGASSAGGIVVGLLPDESASAANPYVTVPIPTGMGEARNAIIVRAAHALIAIGGAYGTLSEIALALRAGIPVIGLETWRLAKTGDFADPLVRVGSAAEAVERAWHAARDRPG